MFRYLYCDRLNIDILPSRYLRYCRYLPKGQVPRCWLAMVACPGLDFVNTSSKLLETLSLRPLAAQPALTALFLYKDHYYPKIWLSESKIFICEKQPLGLVCSVSTGQSFFQVQRALRWLLAMRCVWTQTWFKFWRNKFKVAFKF